MYDCSQALSSTPPAKMWRLPVHLIGFVISPGFQVISLAALSAFELANIAARSRFYEVRVLSEAGGLVPSPAGLSVHAEALDDRIYNSVIFAGGIEQTDADPKIIDFVQRSAASASRVGAICTGAFVLAQAGVLNDRHVTAHWADTQDIERRFPRVKLDDDRMVVIDGPVWTSAGASAGIDLALSMIENDLGPEKARFVAKMLLVHHPRSDRQSPHSMRLEIGAKTDRILAALEFAKANLRCPLDIEQLATVAQLSPRQFSRRFRSETGQSPAKAVENLRVETARIMMEQTNDPMDVIADKTGFADRERMRRAFLRAFGQSPQALRRLAHPLEK